MVFSSITFLFLFLPLVVFFYWLPDIFIIIKKIFYIILSKNNSEKSKVINLDRGKIICNTLISIIISILLLSTFIYFYRYWLSLGEENLTRTKDNNWYPKQFVHNMEEGFVWFNLDKNGYNNFFPKKKDEIDILLVGSSQVEAYQVGSNENIGYLLNSLLKNYYTYNIGTLGHFLPRNVTDLSKVYYLYKPKKYIILETGETGGITYNQEELKSFNSNIKTKKEKKIDYILKKYIPLMKTFGKLLKTLWKRIYSQINLWKEKSDNTFIKNSISNKFNNSLDKKEYSETLNNFLAFARNSVPDNLPIIIFYHPNYTLQSDGSIKNNTDKWALEAFENACKNNNIFFIDTDNELQELYNTKHILPYGFINTAIGSGHLNKYGHEVIAKRLAYEITKLEENNYGSK
jgi:hypothetical protein